MCVRFSLMWWVKIFVLGTKQTHSTKDRFSYPRGPNVNIFLKRGIRCKKDGSRRGGSSSYSWWSLLENESKILAKGISCCSVLAATAASTFGLGRSHGGQLVPGGVPMLQHRHHVDPPTGTKFTRRDRNRLVAPTGAYCAGKGTGSCHDPVPAGARV